MTRPLHIVSLYRPGVLLALMSVLAAGPVACAPKGEALYAEAEQALAKGDFDTAIIHLRNFVAADPNHAEGRALLGQALVQAGEIQAGGIEIRKAKDLGAPREMTLVPECDVLVAERKFDEVLATCQPESAPESARTALQVDTGRALLGLQRPAEAEEHFRAALATQPDRTNAVLGLASAVYLTAGLGPARAVLESAPEAVRKEPRYWLTAAGLEVGGGDLAAAESAFGQALQHSQAGNLLAERTAAYAGLIEMQLRQGKSKEALVTSEAMIAATPESALAKTLRAQALAANGDLDAARTLLEGVVSTEPQNLQARALLGMVHLQQGNLGQAEMNLASVAASDPGNVPVQRMLAEIRTRVQTPQQTLAALEPALLAEDANPSLLAMAGRLSLSAGNREQAVSYFERAAAAATKAQNVEAQLEVASGYLMAGEFDRSIELLQSTPSGAATGYQREYLLMLALLRSGAKDKAIAEGNALLERSGNDPAARNLVAGLLAASGQPDAGRAQYQKALQLQPNDAGTLVNLARLDLAEGHTAEAEANFKKALDADPTNLQATLGAAVAAGAAGNRQGAEEWLAKAVANHPESVEARVALAEARQRNDNPGGAIEVYEQGLAVAPGNPILLNNLAVLYQAQGDPRAIEIAERAYRAAPRAPAIQDTYGWILLAAGKTDQSLGLLRDAAEALSDNAEVQYHYAAALAKSGRPEAALPILRKALDGDLPSEAKAGAQKLVDDLSR
jgi:putative PEP-CTERM system TPR-repeat lipoprotein